MFAVISDIHGNLEALQAVLDDVPEGVDAIYCLGDVIGYGASPNECCDLVREMEMPTISGNHDLAVTDLNTDLSWFNPVAAAAVEWTRSVISPENAEFLLSRPRTMREGPSLFVHGSPRDPDEYILDAAGARENLALLEADYPDVRVCFFGHTHVKTVAPSPEGLADDEEPGEVLTLPDSGPYLVNPGSVGQPRDGDRSASYVLAEVSPDGARVAYRAVAYDVEKAQAKIRTAGLPPILADRLSRGR
jgi:diadenosine tetraphosphatase ApaH/serine/threonine PP2A family protein phosphatase